MMVHFSGFLTEETRKTLPLKALIQENVKDNFLKQKSPFGPGLKTRGG
jgi:hypothetical protein